MTIVVPTLFVETSYIEHRQPQQFDAGTYFALVLRVPERNLLLCIERTCTVDTAKCIPGIYLSVTVRHS